jgi:hypothetical protein
MAYEHDADSHIACLSASAQLSACQQHQPDSQGYRYGLIGDPLLHERLGAGGGQITGPVSHPNHAFYEDEESCASR